MASKMSKTPAKGVKPSTTPMKSKVTKSGKLPHPASSKPKAC